MERNKDKIDKIKLVLLYLANETSDQLNVISKDYKEFIAQVSFCRDDGAEQQKEDVDRICEEFEKYTSTILKKLHNNVLDLKKLAYIIKDRHSQFDDYSDSNSIDESEYIRHIVLSFHSKRQKIHKIIAKIEDDLSNKILIFSQLLDTLTPKHSNSLDHHRKRQKDTTEALQKIVQANVKVCSSFFQIFFKLTEEDYYLAFPLLKGMENNISVCIDYSTTTRFTRSYRSDYEKLFSDKEGLVDYSSFDLINIIKLPYWAIFQGQYLSFITHELVWNIVSYILDTIPKLSDQVQKKKKYSKSLYEFVDGFNESKEKIISEIIYILFSDSSENQYISNQTQYNFKDENIVKKVFVDLVSMYISGPTYYFTLFENFVGLIFLKRIRTTSSFAYDSLVRMMILINLGQEVYFGKTGESNCYTDLFEGTKVYLQFIQTSLNSSFRQSNNEEMPDDLYVVQYFLLTRTLPQVFVNRFKPYIKRITDRPFLDKYSYSWIFQDNSVFFDEIISNTFVEFDKVLDNCKSVVPKNGFLMKIFSDIVNDSDRSYVKKALSDSIKFEAESMNSVALFPWAMLIPEILFEFTAYSIYELARKSKDQFIEEDWKGLHIPKMRWIRTFTSKLHLDILRQNLLHDTLNKVFLKYQPIEWLLSDLNWGNYKSKGGKEVFYEWIRAIWDKHDEKNVVKIDKKYKIFDKHTKQSTVDLNDGPFKKTDSLKCVIGEYDFLIESSTSSYMHQADMLFDWPPALFRDIGKENEPRTIEASGIYKYKRRICEQIYCSNQISNTMNDSNTTTCSFASRFQNQKKNCVLSENRSIKESYCAQDLNHTSVELNILIHDENISYKKIQEFIFFLNSLIDKNQILGSYKIYLSNSWNELIVRYYCSTYNDVLNIICNNDLRNLLYHANETCSFFSVASMRPNLYRQGKKRGYGAIIMPKSKIFPLKKFICSLGPITKLDLFRSNPNHYNTNSGSDSVDYRKEFEFELLDEHKQIECIHRVLGYKDSMIVWKKNTNLYDIFKFVFQAVNPKTNQDKAVKPKSKQDRLALKRCKTTFSFSCNKHESINDT